MRLTLDNGKVQAFENTYASKLAANIAVTNDKIVVLTSGLGTTANPTSVLTDLQTMGDGGGNVTLVVNTALGASVYEVHHSDEKTIDGAQLNGVLSGVASNTLVASNFA